MFLSQMPKFLFESSLVFGDVFGNWNSLYSNSIRWGMDVASWESWGSIIQILLTDFYVDSLGIKVTFISLGIGSMVLKLLPFVK